MARRASAKVTLVLIGAAALGACGGEPETPRARDTYASLDECAADWGRPDNCERQDISTQAGRSTYFHGPVYYTPFRDTAQQEARDDARRTGGGYYGGGGGGGSAFAQQEGPSNRSVGRSTVSPSASTGSTARGGFGASARGFSSGG